MSIAKTDTSVEAYVFTVRFYVIILSAYLYWIDCMEM